MKNIERFRSTRLSTKNTRPPFWAGQYYNGGLFTEMQASQQASTAQVISQPKITIGREEQIR